MKKRILSVLLCLCMVCTLLPITSLAEGTTYDLWVGGVEVTDENKDNITGTGIHGGEGSKVSYDPTSKTLTLNNVSIDGVHSFRNALGTDSAGIYYAGNDFNASLKINLIGTNAIYGQLGTSDISSYGIFSNSFWWKPTFTGNGSLTIQAGNGKYDDEYTTWSVGIYSGNDIIVGPYCTITATSGTANISAAIFIGSYSKLTATQSKVTAGDSADSATEVDITSEDFYSDNYKYMKIEPSSVQPVTAINVTGVTAPVIGQTPDFSTPSFCSTPENAVTVYDNINYRWLKISKDSYTGTSDDIWTPMTSADTFEADYYYRYGVEFQAKVGYEIPANVTGTINGSACTVNAASENYPVMLKTVFGPLIAEHTHNLTPVPETPATCTVAGNIAYYTCSDDCGKWFSDAAGTTEITDHSSVVIAAQGHLTPGEWKHNTGEHWKVCAREGCGMTIENSYGNHSGGEATCVAKAVCSVCDVPYGEVDASNHKHTEIRDAKDATEREKGYTGDTWCLDCDRMIAEGRDIEKLEHKLVLVKAEEATAAKEGNIKYYHCENCGKDYYDEAGTEEIATKEAIVIRKLAPKIIDGNNAKIDKSSKEPVSFRSDAAFADFIRVEVDGKELVKDREYTLKEGSIIAMLTPDFTATLTAGEHTLGIVSASGTALASFTVTADSVSNNNSDKSPQTGDNSSIILWSFIAVLSLAALCTTGLNLKKKRVR